ncbi:MAG: 4-hydroxythreonine-4-phosphate dehydrogenase PdxA [Flavobacteriales bacterium]
MVNERKIKLGISIGDLHGIGFEVIIKTFKDPLIMRKCIPIIFAPYNLCLEYKNLITEDNTSLNKIDSINNAEADQINILESTIYHHNLSIGKPSEASGEIAFDSLKNACIYLENKEIDVLVTAPIDKYQIRKKIPNFIGHTEYLESKFSGSSLMMMVSKAMKIAFVTGHISLLNVPKNINEKKIIDQTIRLKNSLQSDFNIKNPKIAILGLNPHAGENGMLGDEEKSIISPAVKILNEKYNVLSFGPFPADSFFSENNLNSFDGILAMYHDQGLIPFKTLSFSEGVNFTAGLNIIRTSPVHGVAYDIGGKKLANENSFKSAVVSACRIFENRSTHNNQH